ncbi:major facilitator superfamily domain-containing protein [Lasiosphaeria miniovina]|uniref:Major facilitator superfamily domain-containing protein n=1 Tax=Lasiosphaeria miniovina TaxID=1954250 RepID=A0AA40E6J3_9PEZI|nr:major facilitator superfamily domain-containing protein [Lasiosphaeria miniovina]KAK0728855.1 major facilitator superfamily domain-containing protein [Lasiosphaeria miniovina]
MGSAEVPAQDVPTTESDSVNNEKEASRDITTSSVESAGWDGAASKRLMRKIDIHLIPFLALLYLLSFLDRTNIGNARLYELEKDIGLSSVKLQYNDALAIFFPFYVAAEIPSNMAMKRFRPSVWIPSIMVAWAICCTLMGIVHNYSGLMATRVFLGIAEGGLFPGITYYITMWYKRHECGLRMAIFFSAATAAGAFGGLLARGIVEMEGVAGLNGWQWIFILEGILTFVVAIIAYFVMNDYPATAKFLSSEERVEVEARLKRDRSSLADEFATKYFWDAIKDWKIWVHMFITIGVYTGLYSYSLFLPTIIRDLGYTNNTAQLMTVPPYVVACVFCVGAGYLADKLGQRGLFMIFFMGMSIVGLIMLLASQTAGVKYAGSFFLASGIYPNVPQGVAWNGNNIGGSLKRGVGIAMHVGFGNLGGTISAYLFLPRQGPKYYEGFSTLLACQAMAMALSIFMTIYLRRENARRDREYKPPSEYTEEERVAEREKGDNATFFRYTI